VAAGAEIIGINNRNLRTLKVDPKLAERLIPHVPKQCRIVVESGLKTPEEIASYKALHVSAFLIGTTLMKSDDVVGTLEGLVGKKGKNVTGFGS